jgi:mannose/fructose-specific phosphotransferase system component IIA
MKGVMNAHNEALPDADYENHLSSKMRSYSQNKNTTNLKSSYKSCFTFTLIVCLLHNVSQSSSVNPGGSMKIAIVIASNGLLASEFLQIAERTVGQVENVRAIGFHEGESIEDLVNRYRQAKKELNTTNGTAFLIDDKLSCHQYVASQLVHELENGCVITGVNLPMLTSLLLYENNETDIASFSSKAKLYGTAGIHLIEKTDIETAIAKNKNNSELSVV